MRSDNVLHLGKLLSSFGPTLCSRNLVLFSLMNWSMSRVGWTYPYISGTILIMSVKTSLSAQTLNFRALIASRFELGIIILFTSSRRTKLLVQIRARFSTFMFVIWSSCSQSFPVKYGASLC